MMARRGGKRIRMDDPPPAPEYDELHSDALNNILEQSIVDQWIEQYKANRETGLVALMQFFINASGCKGKITEDIQYPVDHTVIIRRMKEEFDKVEKLVLIP